MGNAEDDEVVDVDWAPATGLRAFELACGVLEVKRVASATLRGLRSTAIGRGGVLVDGYCTRMGVRHALGPSSVTSQLMKIYIVAFEI